MQCPQHTRLHCRSKHIIKHNWRHCMLCCLCMQSTALSICTSHCRSMARLIDDQLQDLTAQHEQEIKALERNMDMYKKQSQELEANLEEERWQHQAHVSQIEEEMQTQRPKEEHIRRLEAEKFQSQLSKEARMLSSRRQGKSTSC